jgi:hypothetical protein
MNVFLFGFVVGFAGAAAGIVWLIGGPKALLGIVRARIVGKTL